MLRVYTLSYIHTYIHTYTHREHTMSAYKSLHIYIPINTHIYNAKLYIYIHTYIPKRI